MSGDSQLPEGGNQVEFEEPDHFAWEKITEHAQVRMGVEDLEIIRVDSGSGSYYIFDDEVLYLDPKHVYDPIDSERGMARGCYEAIHDGAHVALSRSPKELGVDDEVIKEKYGRIGYSFTQTAIEDTALNEWSKKTFDEAASLTDDAYGGVFSRRELDVLAEYGIHSLEDAPLFVQFGFETMRRQRQGWRSKTEEIHTDVYNAISVIRKEAEDAIKATPRFSPEYFVKRSARKRLARVDENIWPMAQKFAEQDVLNTMRNIVRRRGAPEAEEEAPDGLPELVPDMSEHAPEPSPFMSDAVDEEAEEETDLGWLPWQAPTHLDGLDIREIADDMVAMSEIFEDPLLGLDETQLKELRLEAEQFLKDIEDAVVKAMRPQHEDEDQPPTHKELDEIKRVEFQLIAQQVELGAVPVFERELSAGAAALTEQVMGEFMGELGTWDTIRFEVIEQRDRLYSMLAPILELERQPQVMLRRFGTRLNKKKAMALDQMRSTDLRIYEVTAPPKDSTKEFHLWFDISGSMEGVPEQESLRAVVTIADTLQLLEVPQLIGVFGDQARVIKEIDDDLDDKREDLSVGLKSISSGTGTNRAAEESVVRFKDSEANIRFAIFVTDGMPNGDAQRPLQVAVEELHEMGVPTIGICIGSNAEEIRKYFAYSIVLSSFGGEGTNIDFAEEMGDLLHAVMANDIPLLIEFIREQEEEKAAA